MIDPYLMENIDFWTETNIKDKKTIEFINNIKSRRLKGIVRKHFEHECYFKHYTLQDFRKEFIDYLNDKEAKYYFLPGLNDHYEDILKYLLKVNERRN